MAILILILCSIIMGLLLLYLHLRTNIIAVAKQIEYLYQEKSSFKISTSTNFKPLQQIIACYQKQREEYFVFIQKQLNQEKEIKNLITNISHDIRTPLTSIKGYLEMLEQTDAKNQGRYFKIVRGRLEDVEEMLDDFFLYSRIHLQNQMADIKPILIYPLICQIVLSYYPELTKKQIIPMFTCLNEQILVNVDESMMKRIIQNLVINVIRYGHNSFKIELKEENDQIILNFSNQIIESFSLEHIFERFYQGDVARKSSGSGLGMAIVKELCNQMDLKVDAKIDDDILTITIIFKKIKC